MSNASKYRKKAVEYEQLKQFDRAISSYARAIEESETAGQEVDVALFNKVGDLSLRQGRVTEAVTYYERAVEHYASVGLFDNAIALCNKILRNAPGRSNVYYTLGRICGRKGLRTDATRNFLEYATRMQADGRVDEGMRALAEVADLMPELVEVRRLVEDHAARAGITLPERRQSTPPHSAAAQPVNAAGRTFGLSKDLVFLDIEYDEPASRGASHAGNSAVPKTAPLADLMQYNPSASYVTASTSDSPSSNGAVVAKPDVVVDGTSILKPYVDPATPLPLLPDLEPTVRSAEPLVVARDDAPMAMDDSRESTDNGAIESEVERADVHETTAQNEVNEVESAAALASDDADAVDTTEPDANDEREHIVIAVDPSDSFTPEENLHSRVAHVGDKIALDADLDDVLPLPSVSTPEDVSAFDLDSMIETPDITEEIDDLALDDVDGFEPVPEVAHARHLDSLPESDTPSSNDAFESDDELPPLIFPMPFDGYPLENVVARQPVDEDGDALFADTPNEPIETVSFDPLSFDPPTYSVGFEAPLFELPAAELPSFEDAAFDEASFSDDAPRDATYGDAAPFGSEPRVPLGAAFEVADSALLHDGSLDEAFGAIAPDTSDLDDLFADSDIPTAVVAAEAAAIADSRRADLERAVADAPSDWALRRRLAEALFEAGEREAGVRELSTALSGHENDGALLEASAVADALVQVDGDDVRHHQKRVELAIRLGDQGRIRDAYLELADNLVRKGDDVRSRAVYARVLEIDPWDDRARAALGDAAPPPPPRVVAGSDEGMVDLADWLRDDGEPLTTRLRMREPEVSGNEENDFNALLRRFKEGVARSLGEDDHDSHYDLGVAYKEMGLLDDAIGEFQKALRSRHNRLAAYEALGQCFLEQGSYKVAVTVLSRALHEPAIRDEQRVGVLYLLGYSCEALQRFDEARGYFERVYATDTLFRDVAQRLADLDRITR